MAFTMHSHSGQFCPGHAKDQLEDVVLHAITIGYKSMGLTEHIPRMAVEDLYPEELEDPLASIAEMPPRHEAYLLEAQRLHTKYADQIELLIGFEGEFIRPSYATLLRDLASNPIIDYFMGSIHHTCGIAIDYDKAFYNKALRAAGGTEVKLYEAYYDEQLVMLQALKPRIVGHFDLIRLLSDEPDRDLKGWSDESAEAVWAKIVRNLTFVQSYGGWLECNTSALRKGLKEAYPCKQIAEEWLRLGGRFTMSDDSHGIAQVATNYPKALQYLESLGVSEVWTFTRVASADKSLTEKAVSIDSFRKSLRLMS